jgi:2-hydroxy-3-oxopropionate reductase
MMSGTAKPPARRDQVAILGLGHMGLPIALRLGQGGCPVRAWTRSGRREIGGEGLTVVDDPGAAIAGADVVILTLVDAPVIESVLFETGAFRAARAGAVIIDMGTTGPAAARSHADRLVKAGLRYLDAPVSGGVAGAAGGALTIFVGGDAATLADARPVLERLGRVNHAGPIGSGQAVKLINQAIVAINIAGVAEAVQLAQRQGLDPGRVLSFLEGGFADSTVLRVHGPRMAKGDFAPKGPCRLHLKDLKLIEQQMDVSTEDLGHLARARAGFAKLVDSGYGDLDHSAYLKLYEPPFRDNAPGTDAQPNSDGPA